ncbi:MAG TPA: hypothetical protein VJJ76_01075 [archaeon]|nr:hypothetical protein [archaeon]
MSAEINEPVVLIVKKEYADQVLKKLKEETTMEFQDKNMATIIGDAQVFLARSGYVAMVLNLFSRSTYGENSGRRLEDTNVGKATLYKTPQQS